VYRAVVFDLWNTLAIWPEEKSGALRRAWSDALGIAADRLDESWSDAALYRLREAGPIATAIAALYERLGIEGDVDGIVAKRLEITREALVPIDGALETLGELRRRRIPTALVSNCTEEVALVWADTPFADLFDVAVFSATAGCVKPEPRIYELALEGLGVAASECLFVGDGASDELEGARRVGMTPVLVCRDGVPAWPRLEEWDGLRIGSIRDVLGLVV
jgi:putative hydrolase of the HAD superfamily